MHPRSFLFVPATSDRKIDKAYASDADAVIVDLEDSVAMSEKGNARTALDTILNVKRSKATWIRVNAMDTVHGYEDLLAITRSGVNGIILPKVESAEQVRAVDWVMSNLERQRSLYHGAIEIMAIVESAKGLIHVNDIAASNPRLRRLMFGAVDLAADLSISLDDDAGATSQSRFAIACASRAANLIAPADTAYTEITNLDGLRKTTERARALGYSAKACIHPNQIQTVNSVFSPSEADVSWAHRVLKVFTEAEKAGLAAIQLDGEMLDYPVAEKARKILQQQRTT
jgi:citrate lyase subunit beta/citryl-CoA lyase